MSELDKPTPRAAEADCAWVYAQMYAFFDEALENEALVVVQQHLQACEGCDDIYAVEQRLRVTIRRCCGAQAPDELRARIQRLCQPPREA